jgi:CubicO group peptidase (beta-lactamase class C family)
MKKLLSFLLPAALFAMTACTNNTDEKALIPAGYSTPEEQGISSRAILEMVEAFENVQPDALHSLMIRRHNQVVAAGWWTPYNPDSPHLLWSLSKSFTSTAIGIAQDEGLLSIDDLVMDYFPDDLPAEPSDNLKSMRISDLLRMNTGHTTEPSWRSLVEENNWPKAFLAHEVPFKPGTHFLYNSMATYMCSAIIQKVTGMTTLDYLTPRLFEPLGIEKPTWDTDPTGVSVGGWGLSLKTEDISKFGQLLLQRGVWKGRQILSAEWVEEATSLRTSNGSNPESDWDQGYGYQFWQCRHNAYRGDGAFGQYCVVIPEQDVVVAITSGSDDLQGILNILWEHLLPAVQDKALPADPEAQEALTEKLESLALSTVKGESGSPLASSVSGSSYVLEENPWGLETLVFDFESNPLMVSIETEGGIQKIPLAYNRIEKGSFPWPGLTSQKIATSGAWTSEDCFEMNLQYYESPQSMQFRFTFIGDEITVELGSRAAFAARELGAFKGRR